MRRVFSGLYAQVLLAIVVGAARRAFRARDRDGPQAARRRLRQAGQDGGDADRVLHGRGRHRQHGRPEEGRPRRRQGADLLRSRDDDGADHRPRHRQPGAPGRRHPRRPGRARLPGGGRLRQGGERAARGDGLRPRRHPGQRRRRLRRGQHPAGAVLRRAVRLRAGAHRRGRPAAGGDHRAGLAGDVQGGGHHHAGGPARGARGHGLHHRRLRLPDARQPGAADGDVLPHLLPVRLRRARRDRLRPRLQHLGVPALHPAGAAAGAGHLVVRVGAAVT